LSQSQKQLSRSSIADQGQVASNIHVVLSGWAYTAIRHSSGSSTVLDVHLPGDFVISPGIITGPRTSTLHALTDCEIAEIPMSTIRDYMKRSDPVTDLFLHLLSEHHRSAAERIVQTTQMPSVARVAKFHLDLLTRAKGVSSAVSDQLYSPVTQSLMASMLGMTEVHVNRTSKQLKSAGALTIKQRIVQYNDIPLLRKFSSIGL